MIKLLMLNWKFFILKRIAYRVCMMMTMICSLLNIHFEIISYSIIKNSFLTMSCFESLMSGSIHPMTESYIDQIHLTIWRNPKFKC